MNELGVYRPVLLPALPPKVSADNLTSCHHGVKPNSPPCLPPHDEHVLKPWPSNQSFYHSVASCQVVTEIKVVSTDIMWVDFFLKCWFTQSSLLSTRHTCSSWMWTWINRHLIVPVAATVHVALSVPVFLSFGLSQRANPYTRGCVPSLPGHPAGVTQWGALARIWRVRIRKMF